MFLKADSGSEEKQVEHRPWEPDAGIQYAHQERDDDSLLENFRRDRGEAAFWSENERRVCSSYCVSPEIQITKALHGFLLPEFSD